MSIKKALIVSLFIFFLVGGCSTVPSEGDKPMEASDTPSSLPTVYLKNNIHVQKQISRRGETIYRASYANYTDPGAGHIIIPVNTPVTIEKSRGIRGRKILITTQPDGKQIHFEFNQRNMAMTIVQYFTLITSPAKVSLSGLSSKDRQGIEEGKAYVGMTKDGVRIALGYPAAHRTASLGSNTWIYWRNRYATRAVDFNENGKVIRIR